MNKFIQATNTGCALICIIGAKTSLIILIAIIGMVKCAFEPYEEPIDRGHKERASVGKSFIVDSLNYGFELMWRTTNAVTKERAKEIMWRDKVLKARREFEKTAPEYFDHDLLNTDIYRFIEYAKRFDIGPDVRLARIFVWGKLKHEYFHPNPNLPGGGCTKYDSKTDKGILYLEEEDIYPKDSLAARRYRYWDCNAISFTDERYTHLTK